MRIWAAGIAALVVLGTGTASAALHPHPGAYVGKTDTGAEVRFGHQKRPTTVYNFSVIRGDHRTTYFREVHVRDHGFHWYSEDYERTVEIHGHWTHDGTVAGRIYFLGGPTKKFHAHLDIPNP